MKVLVLGGGSIRGAYQAGAVKFILESGFEPDIITTISVGSINGMFISNLAGKQKLTAPNKKIDYKKIGEDIWSLWENEIKKPSNVISKRNFLSIVWALIIGKFNGFSSNEPLKKIIKKHIESRYLKFSPIDIYSGTVDLNNGKIFYADKNHTEYIDYAIASSSIPLAMPVSIVKNKPYCDGGLVDCAPLKIAFEKGASEIICVSNSPEHVGAIDVKCNKPFKYIERLLDIILNNSLNNDIREAELINMISPEDGSPIESGVNKGKRRIPITVIRPDSPINVDITDFNEYDVNNMLNLGYNDAKQKLNLNSI
jgi:NTE family protein